MPNTRAKRAFVPTKAWQRQFAKKVLKALRGRKYHQAVGMLKGYAYKEVGTSNEVGFCCLGVIGDCLVNEKIGFRWQACNLLTPKMYADHPNWVDGEEEVGVCDAFLPDKTLKLIGLLGKAQSTGMGMNDLEDDDDLPCDTGYYGSGHAVSIGPTGEQVPVPFELIADHFERAWKLTGVL